MIDLAQKRRARPAPSSRAIACQWINIVFAAVALMLFAITLESQGERAPVGFILGAPLFLLQGLLGLIPAVLYVRREMLVGSARWWLLTPAITGPFLSATASVVSLLTFGGC